MNKMELYKLSETLKDRYSYIFKEKPELSLSPECLEGSAHVVAGIIDRHNKLLKDKGVHEAQTYLIDVVGYYTLLAYDIQKTNEEMLKAINEYIGKDDDN